jgi:hypothetical protein
LIDRVAPTHHLIDKVGAAAGAVPDASMRAKLAMPFDNGAPKRDQRSLWSTALVATLQQLTSVVIPAKAGIHFGHSSNKTRSTWIPAFAGMTSHLKIESIVKARM